MATETVYTVELTADDLAALEAGHRALMRSLAINEKRRDDAHAQHKAVSYMGFGDAVRADQKTLAALRAMIERATPTGTGGTV